MNPTGQPFGMSPPGPQPVGVDARQALNVPSLLVLIAAVLAALFAFVSLASTAMTSGSPDWLLNLIKEPELREQLREAMRQSESNKALNYGWPILMVLANGFAAFGALMMRNLKMYPVALMAGVVSAIPCLFTSCCCVFSMPAGIWAIIVLMKPEVRAQFS